MEEKMSTSRVRRASGHFTFRIENYSGLSSRVGDSTESPEFSLCDHVWQLRIFPGGSLEVHRGHVSFYLASKSTRAARASYKLLVINQSPTGADETFSSSGVRTFEARGVQVDGWGRDKFMAVATMTDPNQQFIVNDAVVFKVEIVVYGELESAGFPVVTSMHSASSTCLAKSLHSMLLAADPSSADLLLLVGRDRRKVWCHRCILAARSSVFRAMLCNYKSDEQADEMVTQALRNSESESVSSSSSSSAAAAAAVAAAATATAAGSNSRSSSSKSNASFGSASIPSLTMISQRPSAAVLACLGRMSSAQLSATFHEEDGEEEKDYLDEEMGDGAGMDMGEESKMMGPDALALASAPVFLESQTGVVLLPDMDVDVVSEFLCYCYTDALSDVTVLSRMGPALLLISSKYHVPSLFTFAEEYLCLHLTVDSALEMLALADTHNASKLKELAMRMVIANALVLTSTSQYKYLSPSLLAEVERSLEDVQRLQLQCCLASSSGGSGGSGSVDGGSTGRRVSQCSIM